VKLFYSPGACSFVSHVALEESGAPFETVRVMLADGEHLRPEYRSVNPHARVPALVTDDGTVTENVAILNYVADRFGAEGSVPRGDPYAAARCNQLLGWFASSVHIAFAQIFRPERFTEDPAAQEAVKAGGGKALGRYFAEMDALAGGGWAAADRFTAADTYLFVFRRWALRIGADISAHHRWAEHAVRVADRPAVQQAIAREGLDASAFLG
jgi:glutathione S-transferase